MGDIQVLLRNVIPPFIRQMEGDFLSLIVESGSVCLLRLCFFTRNPVDFSLFDKTGPGFNKVERDVMFSARIA